MCRYSEIHLGTKNQMAGPYTKNGPSKTIRKLLDWKPMGTRSVGRPRQR